MTQRTYTVKPAPMRIIRDGNELSDLIHEAIWDAYDINGKKPPPLILRLARQLCVSACEEEYDTATEPNGDAYYLVPIPNKERQS